MREAFPTSEERVYAAEKNDGLSHADERPYQVADVVALICRKEEPCGSVLTPVIDKDRRFRLESAEKDDCDQKDKNRGSAYDRGQNTEGGSFRTPLRISQLRSQMRTEAQTMEMDVVSAAEIREEMPQCTKKQG